MSLKILFFTLFLAFSLAGCSTHRVSIEEGVSKGVVYEMDESKVFNLVYSSIQEVFPQEKISVLTEPVRGYITKFLAPPYRLDWFTQKVLVHRSSGTDVAGNKVYGYWIEVSGSGSSFLQGRFKNSEVFETIISHLERSANKYVVYDIRKENYLVDQRNFYVKGADTLEGDELGVIVNSDGESISNSEKLRQLYQLKADGVITSSEFDQVKRKVLEEF